MVVTSGMGEKGHHWEENMEIIGLTELSGWGLQGFVIMHSVLCTLLRVISQFFKKDLVEGIVKECQIPGAFGRRAGPSFEMTRIGPTWKEFQTLLETQRPAPHWGA